MDNFKLHRWCGFVIRAFLRKPSNERHGLQTRAIRNFGGVLIFCRQCIHNYFLYF
jgi:hypothetical protein